MEVFLLWGEKEDICLFIINIIIISISTALQLENIIMMMVNMYRALTTCKAFFWILHLLTTLKEPCYYHLHLTDEKI